MKSVNLLLWLQIKMLVSLKSENHLKCAVTSGILRSFEVHDGESQLFLLLRRFCICSQFAAKYGL